MLTIILQTAAAQPAGNGLWSMLIMFVLIFAVMYFFMIRPQKKQQKAIEEMRKSLTKGDKVITAGGIYGTIADIDETSVLIKVDGDVKIRVDKSCINKDTTASK
ncbi:MAG: preprotein translocase subunit YajC [Bacteroides sp.]|nr:preprotein translocase subunit YajC [Bacteroidales bacterium]MCI6679806.1 preprotein translocase subunit YajC [Bacteroides sp.]MDD7490530.1 preprotein translocase subunit YajC [Bacteroides sp.]MDY5891329.1 preprotein translocase subunit YajC [Candidatus Cryptobacteroides sp.]